MNEHTTINPAAFLSYCLHIKCNLLTFDVKYMLKLISPLIINVYNVHTYICMYVALISSGVHDKTYSLMDRENINKNLFRYNHRFKHL